MLERLIVGVTMVYLVTAFALCTLLVAPILLPLLIIDLVASSPRRVAAETRDGPAGRSASVGGTRAGDDVEGDDDVTPARPRLGGAR